MTLINQISKILNNFETNLVMYNYKIKSLQHITVDKVGHGHFALCKGALHSIQNLPNFVKKKKKIFKKIN